MMQSGMMLLLMGIVIYGQQGSSSSEEAMHSFSTGGHTVYHIKPATVTRNRVRSLISAAYDGHVLCHTVDGKLIWKAQTGGGFPFDLCVADIDRDGLDEALVASADGNLYALDHDGRRLWTFESTPPLFQVCVAQLPDGDSVILTGGVEQVLYALNPAGKVRHTLKTKHCIRHIRAGHILGTEKDYMAIATTSRGLSGNLSLLLVDPATLDVRWEKANLGTHAHNSGKRFFSMVVLDMDKDSKDEILLSNSWGENGKIFAFNHRGEEILTTSDKQIPNVSYRMNLLSHVRLPSDEFVLGHFGNVLIIYNLDGSCREVITGRYSYTNDAYDEKTRTFYMGSAVSGGDGIHALRLDQPGWQQAYEKAQSVGKLAKIERNMETLRSQIAQFKRPAYQPEPRDVEIISRRPANRDYQSLKFIRGMALSQKFENRDELWCRDIDRRRKYDKTADEIVDIVKQAEARGQDFVIWSGHGHAVHMPLSTLEQVLMAAPEHLWGFEFAEMEGVDEHMQEVVEQILLPLAELCRKHGGKKIIFRNKNIFYNGTCYVPFWKKVLLDRRYADVFVPALEETNSRTQELSLVGRVGLWQTGSFNHWSCRMVTDNANWDRMWEWAGQQVLSHHLRHLISRASLGADVFLNSIHQGPFTAGLYEQLTPFYDMLEKGVIHVPQRDELLSISDVCLGMKSPPSDVYVRHGINGHQYRYPRDDHSSMVFDRLDCYWGGAPLLPHDFSYYGLGVQRRMCNFLPDLPYGIIPIVPDDSDLANSRFNRKFTTDGQYFYDDSGSRREAAEYRQVVESALQEATKHLPVRVTGDVHWSVVRIDPTHVRVTLVDPGYLTPADRDADIRLQHLNGTSCVDILSGEILHIENNCIRVHVSMGIIRILDITHY
ncbi:PQQ-binding-like beta-propeller repeat protein [Candidatus Poribacteria bacterium]